MNPILTIVSVSAFDAIRLKKTLETTQDLPNEIEHLFVLPIADKVSIDLINTYKTKVNFLVSVFHDSGQGIYPAMNIGAEKSLGRYLFYLNAGDEIVDPKIISQSLDRLRSINPEWAIIGTNLPWNSSYLAYENMENEFRRQKSDGYVSHQSIFVRKDVFEIVGKFDLKFLIAADTKMIFQLAKMAKPLILDGIGVKVEAGFTVTNHNRESRYEVFKLIIAIGQFTDRILSLGNVLKKETKFIIKKILKLSKD